MTQRNVNDIRELAQRLAGRDGQLQNTIIKAILHTDILRAISASPLAQKLVFQGGTALSLCYGNVRYSEDLDFVHSAPLVQDDFDKFKGLLQAHMERQYGLGVEIQDPRTPLDRRPTAEEIPVHRWTARVTIADPDPSRQQVHRINIEVVDVPAYDPRPQVVRSLYDEALGVSGAPVMLNVSSEAEILADKIVALAGRNYIKARDIWDIKWLKDRGAALRIDWVWQKANDYHLTEGGQVGPFIDRLKKRAGELAREDVLEGFVDEMSRFLAGAESRVWLTDRRTTLSLLMDVSEYITAQVERIAALPAQPVSDGTDALDERLREWQEKHAGPTSSA